MIKIKRKKQEKTCKLILKTKEIEEICIDELAEGHGGEIHIKYKDGTEFIGDLFHFRGINHKGDEEKIGKKVTLLWRPI